jgi:hypothetical protein
MVDDKGRVVNVNVSSSDAGDSARMQCGRVKRLSTVFML